MAKLVHVTAVEVVGDHRLRLNFEDGAEGEVDLSSWRWRGVFEPLADPDYFRQVRLDEKLGTIVWPNGADLAPETLHAWVARGVEARACVGRHDTASSRVTVCVASDPPTGRGYGATTVKMTTRLNVVPSICAP